MTTGNPVIEKMRHLTFETFIHNFNWKGTNVGRPISAVLRDTCWFTQITKQVGVAGTFILQSYMDMHELLGDTSELHVDVYKQEVDQSSARLNAHWEFKKENNPQPAFPGTFISSRLMEEQIQEDLDFKKLLEADDFKPGRRAKSSDISRVRMLQAIALLPADRVRFLKLRMHEMRVWWANGGLVLQHMAYLYRAAQQLKLIEGVWTDMETLISLQSKVKPFVMEVAAHASPADWYDHVSIHCYGRSIQSAKANSASGMKKKVLTIETGVEWIKMASAEQPKMEIAQDDVIRIGKAEGRDISMSTARKISKSWKVPVAFADHGIIKWDEQVAYRMCQTHASSKGSANQESGTSTRHHFTAIECLEAIKAAWIRDEFELNFDYVEFWMVCTELLKKIRKFSSPRIRQAGQAAALDHRERIWVDVAVLILDEAAWWSDTDPGKMDHSMLAVVANLMDKVMKSQGDVVTKKAERLCGGRPLQTQEKNEDEQLGENSQEQSQEGSKEQSLEANQEASPWDAKELSQEEAKQQLKEQGKAKESEEKMEEKAAA